MLLGDVDSLIPLLACAGSLALLCFQQGLHCFQKPSDYTVLRSPASLLYSSIRLLGCILIQLLTLASWMDPRRSTEAASWSQNWPFVVADTYSTALAVIAHSRVSPSKLRSKVSAHLTFVLLSTLGLYTYRDLWPIFTFNKYPADAAAGSILWVKIGLLASTAIFLPLFIPRDYVPIDPEHPMEIPSVEQTASWFSKLTHAYLDKIIWLARKNGTLRIEDLPPLIDFDRASVLTARARPELDPILSNTRRHLFWSLLRVFKNRILWLVELQVALIVSGFISQIALKQLLDYLGHTQKVVTVRPIFWILCLFFGPVIRVIVAESYTAIATRNVVQIGVVLTDVLLSHSLRIRLSSKEESGGNNLIGKLNNLAMIDIPNISRVAEYWIVVLFFPFQLFLSTVFLYIILGWSAFVGLAVMILCSPLAGYFSSILQAIQKENMKKTDARVQKVVEVLNILRMIKLLGWERKMKEQIELKREEELVMIRKSKLMTLLSTNINLLVPLFTMMTTFGAYALIQRRELTASTVFASLAVFEAIRAQFQQILSSVTDLVNGKVSMDRLGDFLQQTELLDGYLKSPPTSVSTVVGFRDASFTWIQGGDRKFVLNIHGDLVFLPGINLVIGPTSAGKTSLLLALLGEMRYSPLTADSFVSLPRVGGVAYAAQESWIQNDTIKSNILFGSTFNAERYQKVLYQCALLPDLEMFHAGDETEIGEKGVTLSGGQKARITLARAVYSAAQIILLDDPLAALDVRTANWVVEKCLTADLVQGRTVIMTTHNVSLTRPMARYIVSIALDGTITHGSSTTFLGEDTLAELENELLPDEMNGGPNEFRTNKNGKIMAVEKVEEGVIGWGAWQLYFSNLSKYPILLWGAWIGCMILKESALSVQAWLLGAWSSEYERRPAKEVAVMRYLLGYCLLLLISMILYAIGYTVFIFGQLRAGRRIHKLLVDSVLGATFRWLDVTPVSHIIARATFDMKAVDDSVSSTLGSVIELAALLVVKFLSVLLVTPNFLFPGLIFILLSLVLGRLYMTTQLPVKRIVSNTKSPILAHFAATITGLASVRAYGAQDQIMKELLRRLDQCTAPSITYWNLNRWVAVRTQTVGSAFTACLAAYLVYGGGENATAADSGFSLTMAVIFTSLILRFVRYFNSFEVNGNSLERLLQYLNIDQEPKPTPQGSPPAYWPSTGEIRVDHLSARYTPDGPDILHDFSFTISSGERIAIVGHTGCGKSSLILSLLRCIPTQGEVYYDGFPTSTMNLESLRSSVSIIPQNPDLLAGTVRDNLDPFAEYDDALLVSSLRSAGLYALQADDPDASLSLDSRISGGGSNISLGQRQIIALARALLRGSKVLILDEATSSIDHATDTIIQQSLRSEAKNVTVIAVAHRLTTIMDFDKIMVLDRGVMVEYDTPLKLLKKKGGYLRALVDESSDREKLLDMAGV